MLKNLGFILLCWTFTAAYANTETLAYEEQTLTLDGAWHTARVPKGYRLEFLSRLDEPRMLTFAPNARLVSFGRSLGRYLQQIAYFLTFASEDTPFPFSDWPSGV